MITTYRNTAIHYEVEGHGNPMVLLHGFLETNWIWKKFTEEFSQHRQVICIELPGHGSSGNLAEEHSMELMAEVVNHVLEELKTEKADLLGHSMGGYVALAFLEKYAGKVNKLILMNSTPAPDSDERKENRKRSIDLVKRNKKAFVSMAISNLLTPENKKKFRDYIEELKTEALRSSEEGIVAALQGMKNRTDRTSILQQFSGNKYILTAEKDPIIDLKEIKSIANQCKCKLYTFSDGHLSYLENKKEFHEIVYFIE